MLYFVVLSNSSTIFNITLEVNFDAGKNYAIAKNFIQLVHCTIYSNVQSGMKCLGMVHIVKLPRVAIHNLEAIFATIFTLQSYFTKREIIYNAKKWSHHL